jgi:hypothetical protein
MWEPRRLTILWAFTACYRNSFTFLILTKTSRSSNPAPYRKEDITDSIYNLCVTHNFKTVLNNTNQLFKTGFTEFDESAVSVLVE